MSASRETTIWCDVVDPNLGGCPEWDQRSGNAALVREELRRFGWLHKQGRDICPKCREVEL